MVVSTRVQELLEKTLAILPITDEDVIFKGITAEVMDRIVELKKAALRLSDEVRFFRGFDQEGGTGGCFS